MQPLYSSYSQPDNGSILLSERKKIDIIREIVDSLSERVNGLKSDTNFGEMHKRINGIKSSHIKLNKVIDEDQASVTRLNKKADTNARALDRCDGSIKKLGKAVSEAETSTEKLHHLADENSRALDQCATSIERLSSKVHKGEASLKELNERADRNIKALSKCGGSIKKLSSKIDKVEASVGKKNDATLKIKDSSDSKIKPERQKNRKARWIIKNLYKNFRSTLKAVYDFASAFFSRLSSACYQYIFSPIKLYFANFQNHLRFTSSHKGEKHILF